MLLENKSGADGIAQVFNSESMPLAKSSPARRQHRLLRFEIERSRHKSFKNGHRPQTGRIHAIAGGLVLYDLTPKKAHPTNNPTSTTMESSPVVTLWRVAYIQFPLHCIRLGLLTYESPRYEMLVVVVVECCGEWQPLPVASVIHERSS